jgi:hypothetical protein
MAFEAPKSPKKTASGRLENKCLGCLFPSNKLKMIQGFLQKLKSERISAQPKVLTVETTRKESRGIEASSWANEASAGKRMSQSTPSKTDSAISLDSNRHSLDRSRENRHSLNRHSLNRHSLNRHSPQSPLSPIHRARSDSIIPAPMTSPMTLQGPHSFAYFPQRTSVQVTGVEQDELGNWIYLIQVGMANSTGLLLNRSIKDFVAFHCSVITLWNYGNLKERDVPFLDPMDDDAVLSSLSILKMRRYMNFYIQTLHDLPLSGQGLAILDRFLSIRRDVDHSIEQVIVQPYSTKIPKSFISINLSNGKVCKWKGSVVFELVDIEELKIKASMEFQEELIGDLWYINDIFQRVQLWSVRELKLLLEAREILTLSN